MIRRVVPAGEVTLSLKTLERLLRTIREQKELIDAYSPSGFEQTSEHAFISDYAFQFIDRKSGRSVSDSLSNIYKYVDCKAFRLFNDTSKIVHNLYDEAAPKA